MISKRNNSFKQQALRVAEMSGNFVSSAVPFLFCAGSTFLALDALQGLIDQKVIDQCPINISQLVPTKTVLGDIYSCVSRQQIYGPPLPLKD
jgi:hypothetical protein